MMEGARAEGSTSTTDTPNSPRAGRLDTNSPLAQPHAVPEWLISPRSTPTGSKRLSSESSSPLPLPGLPGHADSISPGSLHRLNVFSNPASRRVSSEGSAQAAPNRAEEEGKGALREELAGAQQQSDDVVPKQPVHQVTPKMLKHKSIFNPIQFQYVKSCDLDSMSHIHMLTGVVMGVGI